MAAVSQKCQYALRALYELVARRSPGPVPIARIAEAQAIPPRFLELILGELRQGGFVTSRRGKRGGYQLAVRPDQLTVGEVIRFVDGPIAPVRCITDEPGSQCPLYGGCAFLGLWQRARDALAGVYDSTSLQDILEDRLPRGVTPNYCI